MRINVWYLGIVDNVFENKVNIIHMKRTDKQGLKWIVPENPENRPVEMDQTLLRNIIVMYYGVSCRIEIRKATLNDIKKRVKDLKE